MKVAIGADHGGFQLKEDLKPILKTWADEIIDVGTDSTQSVDYPDFAVKVALLVANGEVDFGIMIDGVGVGSAMVANKIPNVRCAVVNEVFTAVNARVHNHANMITMGSRVIGLEVAKLILKHFFESIPDEGRHKKRVEKIMKIQNMVLQNAVKFLGNSNSNDALIEEVAVKKKEISKKVLKFVSEREVMESGEEIYIYKNSIVTPLAKDLIRDLGKKLVVVD